MPDAMAGELGHAQKEQEHQEHGRSDESDGARSA
jgi:hypothetical protein